MPRDVTSKHIPKEGLMKPYIDFPDIVEDGENPNGFRAVTPDGGVEGNYQGIPDCAPFSDPAYGNSQDGPRWNPSWADNGVRFVGADAPPYAPPSPTPKRQGGG